jgi:hypothetical protein
MADFSIDYSQFQETNMELEQRYKEKISALQDNID